MLAKDNTYLHQNLGDAGGTKWLVVVSMFLSYVFKALEGGPLQDKGVRVGQHSNELDNVRVTQSAKLVQFKAHVTVASFQLSCCVG